MSSRSLFHVLCATATLAASLAAQQERCVAVDFDLVVSSLNRPAATPRWFATDSTVAGGSFVPLDWNGFLEPELDAFAPDQRFCALLVALKRSDAAPITIERCELASVPAGFAGPTVVAQTQVFAVPGTENFVPQLLHRDKQGTYVLVARTPDGSQPLNVMARLSIGSASGFAIPLPVASAIADPILSVTSDARGNVFVVSTTSSSTRVERIDPAGATKTTVWCSATHPSGADMTFAFCAAVDHSTETLIVGGASNTVAAGNITCLPTNGAACPTTATNQLSTTPGTLVNTLDLYADRQGFTLAAQAVPTAGATVGRVARYLGCPTNATLGNSFTLPANTFATRIAVLAQHPVFNGQFGLPSPLDGVTPAREVFDVAPFPVIGSIWTVAADGFAAGQFVVAAWGFSDVSFGGVVPLPFALDPSGVTLLSVDPFASPMLVADASGTATLNVAIPVSPVLIGQSIMAQFLSVTGAGAIAATAATANTIR